MQKMLTTREAAAELGVAEKTIRFWIFQRKNLAFVRCGRSIRISQEEIHRFVSANTMEPKKDSEHK